MERVGLIAAMLSESKALLGMVKDTRRVRLGLQHGIAFQVAERECTLVTSGMGIRQAAVAAQLLFENTHPDLLISFGIAGAVYEDLRIGDVVMATGNASLENGALSRPQPLTGLAEETWEEVKSKLSVDGIQSCMGTAITTRGSQLIPKTDELVHPILEMETAGLLQVTQAYGVPLVVLRAISDGPKAPLPLDLAAVMDEDSRLILWKLAGELIKHPGILRRAGPMLRNSRIAAGHAARAVMLTLQSQLSLLKA